MNRNPTNYGSITDPEVGFSGDRGDDISRQFNSLCDDVATKLYTINSSTKALQDSFKLIGTPRDNTHIRSKIHITQHSANQVASAATRDISKLKTITPSNDKPRQLQVEKLEEDFKETINKYYSLQKELADKQKANLLLSANAGHPSSDGDESPTEEKQTQLTRDLQFDQDMMLEREERVKQIEADVLDINEIMRELGSLVHNQADAINTIENSIDHAAGNVEEGADQLVKASGYQSRYRKRMLILVVVAAVILIILISVLVTELRK